VCKFDQARHNQITRGVNTAIGSVTLAIVGDAWSCQFAFQRLRLQRHARALK